MKTEAVSFGEERANRVDEMFRDFDKSNQNLRYERGNSSGDSEVFRLSDTDRKSLSQFSIIHEA